MRTSIKKDVRAAMKVSPATKAEIKALKKDHPNIITFQSGNVRQKYADLGLGKSPHIIEQAIDRLEPLPGWMDGLLSFTRL